VFSIITIGHIPHSFVFELKVFDLRKNV